MKPIRLLPLAAVSGLALTLAGCVVAPVDYGPGPVVRAVVAYDEPPPLPYYDIPACPEDGMHWIPGYWGWGNAGYYWVPGNWVRPPRLGVLWTPGYWSLEFGGRYTFHDGYWGSSVGYYGGINYGGGYFGSGFYGGRWDRGTWRVNAEIYDAGRVRNVYRERPVTNIIINGPRSSYAGARNDRRDDRGPRFNGNGNDGPPPRRDFDRPAPQQMPQRPPPQPRPFEQQRPSEQPRNFEPQRPFEQQRPPTPPPQQQPQQRPPPQVTPPPQRPQEQQQPQEKRQPERRRREDDDRPGSSER